MDKEEALKLLRGGDKGVAEWNRRREAGEPIPELRGADLSRANLHEANLSGADLGEAELRGADLRRVYLHSADLRGADLSEASLLAANLCRANLRRAVLWRAELALSYLSWSNLSGAALPDADLSDADLRSADLRDAELAGARLCGANLGDADLGGSDLRGADFEGAWFGQTRIGNVDLSACRLEHAAHTGPSTISVDTLIRSKGRIPEAFLRGCGLTDLEIEFAMLYDPARSALEVSEIANRIAELRMQPIAIGGVFISYSWDDSGFVDLLYECLKQERISVWLDKHEMVAGPVKRQVVNAIRVKDVVVLVLSEHSVDSDWVEYELEAARKKEKAEQRDVLCPVALDEAWKPRMDDPLWRQVKKDYVVDFSDWESEGAFEAQFKRLLKGLKIYYEPPAGGPLPERKAGES